MTTEIYKQDGKVFKKTSVITEIEIINPEVRINDLNVEIADKQAELDKLLKEKADLEKI